MTLIAGANNDQFYADCYALLLQPAKPDLTVELVPGLEHVDMLTDPAALAALRRTFDISCRAKRIQLRRVGPVRARVFL